MRYESRVVSVSWIPSEAVGGLTAVPFDTGLAHYDAPPPDILTDLDALKAQDGFRFANELRAWIEVEDGQIVGHGYSGQGHLGSTTLRVGERNMTFAAVALPEIQQTPEVHGGRVKFVQTAGGRAGVPAPRHVKRPPYIQVAAPLAWTTLSLSLASNGTATGNIVGASSFPRHWLYDGEGRLVAKSGLIDFETWYREAFGDHSPWGDEDSPALVSAVETALKRELSGVIMRGGAKPDIRTVKKGWPLVEQGEPGDELFLLLDGVLSAEVDGRPLAEIGPGAILGEQAVLEGGRRTATLRAVTRCKVAAVPGSALDPDALRQVSEGHRREEQPGP